MSNVAEQTNTLVALSNGYTIDRTGQIFNSKNKPLKNFLDNGTIKCNITLGTKRKNFLIALLVAQSFIDKDAKYVYFKDKNRLNTHSDNLITFKDRGEFMKHVWSTKETKGKIRQKTKLSIVPNEPEQPKPVAATKDVVELEFGKIALKSVPAYQCEDYKLFTDKSAAIHHQSILTVAKEQAKLAIDAMAGYALAEKIFLVAMNYTGKKPYENFKDVMDNNDDVKNLTTEKFFAGTHRFDSYDEAELHLKKSALQKNLPRKREDIIEYILNNQNLFKK